MKETLYNLKKVYKYGKKYKKALILQIICCIIFITFAQIFLLSSFYFIKEIPSCQLCKKER